MKYPSGKWGFVGHVPIELAYIHSDGHALTESEQKDIATASFPAMACKRYGVQKRIWDSEQGAIFAAARAGFKVQE